MHQPQGSTWQFLSSAVLTAFAFEAYLNHVGPSVMTCWSEVDRLPPWSKFRLLCEVLEVKFLDGPDKRPLQTIRNLIEFRNMTAHGRSEKIEPEPHTRSINDKLDGYLGEVTLSQWESLIQTKEFAIRVREDVEVVLRQVHNARPEPKEQLFAFGIGEHSAHVKPNSTDV